MRAITILLVLICSVLPVGARNIKGIVLSSNDSTAVVGANCRLLSEGKLVAGVAADANGAFTLDTDNKSALTLTISMTGFSSTDIIIESGAKNLNLGTIYLDEGVALDEVSVTASSIVKSNGKTIVYPSSADVKASATSIGLFQKLPLSGLQADPINRKISVAGGTPVILINGVPSTIDDFNAIQPKDIEKIEYSRFTPARYADSGNTGFINITLKRRTDGGEIYAWGRTALNTAFVDGNIRASYHQGASQLALQYVPSWRNYQQVYDNVVESYNGDDFNVDLNRQDRSPFYYHMHQLNLKYDYSPSTKTLFSATFKLTPLYNKHRTIAHTDDSELGGYDINSLWTSKDLAPSLDLFLHQEFNEKNSLELQVVGTLSSNDYRRNNNYLFADGSDEAYIMNVDSRRRSLISEASYIHTFSEKTTLSAGFQNTVSRSTNTYLLSDYKPILTENNNYAYLRFGQRIGKLNLTLSTGAKMFWIKNDMNNRNFIRNLSSANLSWDINSNWSMEAVFRYSPTIPSLTALTDYPQQVTPYLISNGNPDLKVAENFTYNLGVDYSYKKFQASFVSAYANEKNSVISDIIYLGDRKFISQSVNARYRHIIDNDLTVRISDIYGFGAAFNIDLTNYRTAGTDWSHNLTSFSAYMSLWWNKGPYTISYFRKFPGKYLKGHNIGKDENGDALQFDWSPNKHWNIGASWMYMFENKGTRYPA